MKIIISNSSDLPIYEQISPPDQKPDHETASSKRANRFPPSASWPTSSRSASSPQAGYDDLEREGFLDSVGGKGTFVSSRIWI